MPASLRDFRDAAGLTLAALADRVGTTVSQISRLEKGERKLTKQWAERLAPHLGTTWWSLLGAPASGVAEPAAAFATPGQPTSPPVTDITIEEDDGYDALLVAVEALARDEGAALTRREFAHLVRTMWQEVTDEGDQLPLADRIHTVIERRRTMFRTARQLAVGKWRRR